VVAEVGGLVAVEDLLQGLGRCAGCDCFGPDEGVRVAVADDLKVEMVGDPPSGEHGVQLLPCLLSSYEAVHGVGGDALGGVDGGGVAESGRGLNVVGGEPFGEAAAGVPDGQSTSSADVGDGPAVTVLDPVGGAEA
jgi:hypothetical protein